MTRPSFFWRATRRVLAVLAAALTAFPLPSASADDVPPIRISLKDHVFTPAEIPLTAGKTVTLQVTNSDDTAAEFECKPLRIEKMVPGGGVISVQAHATSAGRLKFVDEYREDATVGFFVVQ